MEFIYPDKLYSSLKKRWSTKRFKDEHIPELPNKKICDEIINSVYQASFLTEESRRIWIRVIYKNPKGSGDKESMREINYIRFQSPRDFNVDELIKLAPAADPTQILIGVYILDNKLKIWGLIDSGISWWNYIRGESSGGSPPPTGLIVSSKKPGEINISKQGDILFILRQGKIVEPSDRIFYEGQVKNFLFKGADRLHDEVCKKLNDKKFDKKGHDEDYPRTLYIYFIKRILDRIREKFHGGTLLMIPDEVDINDTRLTDRILIKYPCEYRKSWEYLIDELVRHRKYYDLHFKLYDQKSISNKEYEDVSHLEYMEDDVEENTANAVRFISSLSSVDGAVVITDRLKLLGFGAEIIATSPSLKKVKLITYFKKNLGEYKEIELFGTRHKSALRFCSSYENSIAFIVSQEGDIKICKRVGSEVLLWSDINVGSMVF